MEEDRWLQELTVLKEHKSTITKVCIMTESCHFDDKNSLGGSFCVVRLEAHVSNGLKSRIRPVVGGI